MKKLIIFIMMMISLIFSACGVNNLEESSAELIYAEQEQKQSLSQQEIVPTGIVLETTEMNNFIRYSNAFAQDNSFVYFDDSINIYTIDKDTGIIERIPISSLNNYKSLYYSAIITEGTVFSHTGGIWKTEAPEKGWRICSRISHEDTNTFTYSNGPVLPYKEYIYYLYSPSDAEDECSMILRGSIRDLQVIDQTISINSVPYSYIELKNADIVFQEDGLKSFGIYSNYLVAITDNADIWVIDIKNGKSNQIIRGNDICRISSSKYFAVDGEYIYYTNDNEERFERIRFDGTGRETILDGMSGARRDLFNCADGYLYHIDRVDENDEYHLFRTNLTNSTDRIVLATGDSEGVSPASRPQLYIIDDWVYYQTATSGYWRSKMDGSDAELITYAATTEDNDEWNPEMVKVKSIAVGYEHTVALKSDGTVVATGANQNGECNVSEWENIISVYASEGRTIGLRADGSVCVAGSLYTNESLSQLSNTIEIDVGVGIIVGIKADGQAIAAGTNSTGATKVSDWNDMVGISTSRSHTVGVKSDGTVLATGDNQFGQCDVFEWTDIVDVATSGNQAVGLKSDGTVITTLKDEKGNEVKIDWTDIVSIEIYGEDILGVKKNGTIVTIGNQDFSDWTNMVDVSCCSSHNIGLKSDGTLIAKGSELYDMCDVSSWDDIKVPIG